MRTDYWQEGRKTRRLQIVCNSIQTVDAVLGERFTQYVYKDH